MVEKSGLNKRIHRLKDLFCCIFESLSEIFKNGNESMEYIIDSFPVEVCDNIRISRCKIIKGKEYRGYCASKRRYFYGVKVQILSTADGVPVEICMTPGNAHDSKAFDVLNFFLPKGSRVYADSGYTDYFVEDAFKESDGIDFTPCRKKISQRQDDFPTKLLKSYMRKRIETVISQIVAQFPRKIHAVTFEGFLMKILNFILGYTIHNSFGSLI